MKRIFPAFALGILLYSPTLLNAQLEVEHYTLDNGFTVILNPDKTVNNVFGAVAVNTGSKNDPETATGISHYLEHLLFKGTEELGTFDYQSEKVHLDSVNHYYDELGKTTDEEKREQIQLKINQHALEASKYAMPNEFDKLLKSIGSTGVNATTSRDLTWYYNAFPSHQIYKWLDLYAHRFEKPVFRSFQSELEVVYEEKNRAMDNMRRRLFSTFDKKFYKGHPYGDKSLLGTVDHLKNPSLTKMYDYFNTYYVPNNMALILSGNFDAERIKPQIEQLYGKWKRKELKENTYPAVASFKGRELHKSRLTPIKVSLMGFSTVPRFHPDELTLDVIASLLQNEAGTGLIDQLQNDNKVMNAWAFPDNEGEAGKMTFIVIPKILIQSFKSAEEQLLGQLEKLKSGNFSENQLQAVKNEMYNNHQLGMESPRYRGRLMASLFTHQKSWEEIEDYPELLNRVSKEDIQRIAKKYFGNDYMVLHSRTGFPKKNKLDKPNFKAVQVDQSKESVYAKRFKEMKEADLEPKFIDFNKGLDIVELGNQNKLFTVKNPINDIYEMNIKYKIGTFSDRNLEVLSHLMSKGYPQGSKRTAFKESVSLLGSNYTFFVDDNYFTINLVGIEKNLATVLKKVDSLMQFTTFDEDGLKAVKNNFKADYKEQKENPSKITQAIAQYGLFGEKSEFVQRLSYKEINNLSLDELHSTLAEVKQYSANIHYSGKKSSEEIKEIIQNNFQLSQEGKSNAPILVEAPKRDQNEILVIDNKKLVQSTMFFIKNTPKFELSQYPKIKLFNTYFDGGFSGILMQEIREYRSLAYTASAKYRFKNHPESSSFFFTYVGCQADKTNETVDVAFDLINNIPQKEDRMELVKSSVLLSQFSNYPNFRTLSTRVETYLQKGLTEDPNKLAYAQYEQLEFKDMISFYKENIQKVPSFLGIYGDTKRFDIDELKNHGTVKKVKLEEIIKF